MTPGPEPCADLKLIADKWDGNQDDPLLVFAATHYCICKQVAARCDNLLDELNREFCRKFVSVYNSWSRRHFRGLHIRWVWALTDYNRGKLIGTEALIEFAFVHIAVDLRHVLCLFAVPPQAYSAVNTDVNECVRRVVLPYVFSRNPGQDLERAVMTMLADRFKQVAEAVVHKTVAQPSIMGFRWWIYRQALRDRATGCIEARRQTV